MLSDLINLTRKPMVLRRDHDNSENTLTTIATKVDEMIMYHEDRFVLRFCPEGGDTIEVQVYDDHDWGLAIELYQSNRLKKKETFAIDKVARYNPCPVSFVFKPDVIWFYPIHKSTILLDADAYDGWFLKVGGTNWEWEGYKISTRI